MAKGKTFKGFSDEQMKRIAGKLGFQGPVENFGQFLQSNPAMAAKYAGLEAKAKMKFAEGGVVTDPNATTTTTDPNAAPETPAVPGITTETATRMAAPTVPMGAAVIPAAVTTTPEQTIAAGTGEVTGDGAQVTTAPTTVSTAAQPATMDAATMQATTAAPAVQAQTAANKAAEGVIRSESTIAAQEGAISPDALAEGAQYNESYLTQVSPQERAVTQTELAQAAGQSAKAIESKIAESDALVEAVAVQGAVNPNELPLPAQIAESDMAQAQAITADGLAPDAIAVAAKLNNFTVDAGTLAKFEAGEINAQSTVQGQLASLMKSFDDGTPAWAAGAIRAANAAMNARGLGGSSMAGAAILQATMESAIPIAQQDAQTYAQMGLANLNTKTQVALSNAAAQQGVQISNFNAEQQSALQNSANAFALQSQNLSNMQQAVISNAQIKAALQGQNLSNQQQSNMATAARYAEMANINLNNAQQTALQNNSNSLQTNLANLSAKQQAYVTNAQLAASLQGQVISNEQQTAITNAARFAEANNMTFTAEQQAQLHNSSLMQSIGLADLNTRQAAVLQNAATIAGMDMANLNNRQQAAVVNAQSFLQMDMANLSNEQQTSLFNTQANIQALLSDQAAENAAKQFNATSQNQVDQFFAGLSTQVAQFNATQTNAMTQFDETNAIDVAKYNSSIKNQREQFNAQNQLVIAQSNAQWRREIATIDNATVNAANEFNAKSLLDISNQAYDNMWQQYEDIIEYAWRSGEAERDRINELVRTQIGADATLKAAELQSDAESSSALGGFFASALFGSGGFMSRLGNNRSNNYVNRNGWCVQ
jgi:hypothetical protein